MKLTKKEEAWLLRFEKTMAAAPPSLGNKVWAYTIGDSDITLYNKAKFDKHFEENPINESFDTRDHCTLVADSDSELMSIGFPPPVESTAG
jgi:hypothetical protein